MQSTLKRSVKWVYRHIPFKRSIFSVLKSFWSPPESIYRHLHFEEPFTVQLPGSGSFRIHGGNQIENEIFWQGITGKWEKESLKLWLQLASFSHTILDIGANSGVYAFAARAVNPTATVCAFEPHPLFYGLLERNQQLNPPIQSYRVAVSNLDGEIEIEDYSGRTPFIQTRAVTLDTFIAEQNLGPVDLVKIDVETHEPQVLAGFAAGLAQSRPAMLIEILNPQIADQVYEQVKDLGYLYFNIDERLGVRQTALLEKSDHFNYLICQPEVARRLGLGYTLQ